MSVWDSIFEQQQAQVLLAAQQQQQAEHLLTSSPSGSKMSTMAREGQKRMRAAIKEKMLMKNESIKLLSAGCSSLL